MFELLALPKTILYPIGLQMAGIRDEALLMQNWKNNLIISVLIYITLSTVIWFGLAIYLGAKEW